MAQYNIENMEDYIRSICEICNVSGMSVVILDNEQEYYINVGYADKNEEVGMTSEIRFESGSATKAFTALDILILEQDGKLNRADSVNDYLPWFHPTYDGNEAKLLEDTDIRLWKQENMMRLLFLLEKKGKKKYADTKAFFCLLMAVIALSIIKQG